MGKDESRPGLKAYVLTEEERQEYLPEEGQKTANQKSPGEVADEAEKELLDWSEIEEDERTFAILHEVKDKCEKFPKLLEDIVATHGEEEGRALQDIRWRVMDLLGWLKNKMINISDPYKRKNVRQRMFPLGVKDYEIAAALYLRDMVGDERKFVNLLGNINWGDIILDVPAEKIEELYDEFLEENEKENSEPKIELNIKDDEDFPPDEASGTS